MSMGISSSTSLGSSGSLAKPNVQPDSPTAVIATTSPAAMTFAAIFLFIAFPSNFFVYPSFRFLFVTG